MWRLDEILEAVKGTAYRVEKDIFANISTDSRTIGKGELFIPIAGPSFDGHLFIGTAYGKSHGGALCEKTRETIYADAPGTIILVDDTLEALLNLARYKRERLNTTCIAITGSNGKTTTKEILIHMMKESVPVHFNEKNYNNLIGVSKSILAIEGEPEFCVFEMGTNSKGEIRRLAEAAMPDISLITNINPSHLEGLKTMEGILEEKLDLFYHTKENGRVFINADDPLIMPRYKDLKRIPLVYGIANEAPFHLAIDKRFGWEGSQITITFPDDSLTAKTSLLGTHNLYNILAASSIAHHIGINKEIIGKAIETFTSYSMRFKPVVTGKGVAIIDDTYNANPSSMEWAIKTLLELPAEGKKIVILGDMRELGEKSREYHCQLGRFLKASAVPMTILIGEEVKATYEEIGKERAQIFEDKRSLVKYVSEQVHRGDTILIKGSRYSKMEEIVEALK